MYKFNMTRNKQFLNKGQVKTMFVVAIVVLTCESMAQTGDDAKALMESLFKGNGYNKDVRPSQNQSVPTQVDIDMYLVAINGIDAVTQKLVTTGFLDIYWTDEFLTWSPPDVGGLRTLYVSQNDIWKPDISLQNGFKKLDELGSSFIKVIISSDGELRWSPFEIFETKCDIDIQKFPFDEQTCSIVFVVWSYSKLDVNITKGSKGINFYNFKRNGEWEVVSTSSRVDMSSETRVMFSLTVRRIPTFYLINVIAPVVLLAILNVFTYMLPVDCGEKMSYSITVFLSFAVFLSIVSSTLPKTSGSILAYYLIFQLGMGTIVVMVTAVELRLHFRSDPVPRWLEAVFRCKHLQESRNRSEARSTNHNITAIGDNVSKGFAHVNEIALMSWSDITAAMDRIMFWISLTIVIAMTILIYVLMMVY